MTGGHFLYALFRSCCNSKHFSGSFDSALGQTQRSRQRHGPSTSWLKLPGKLAEGRVAAGQRQLRLR